MSSGGAGCDDHAVEFVFGDFVSDDSLGVL